MTEGEGGGEKNGKVRNAKGKGGDGGGEISRPTKWRWGHTVWRGGEERMGIMSGAERD